MKGEAKMDEEMKRRQITKYENTIKRKQATVKTYNSLYELKLGQVREGLEEALYEFIDCDGDQDCDEFKSLYRLMLDIRIQRRKYFNYVEELER